MDFDVAMAAYEKSNPIGVIADAFPHYPAGPVLPAIPGPDQSDAQVIAGLVGQLGTGPDAILALAAAVRAKLQEDTSLGEGEFHRLDGQLHRLERGVMRRRRRTA